MTETFLKSINDLPPEILELVAEYLDPADLTALRSVNRKCHDVLTADKFWKRYLKYPEKYFLCDLLSKSTLPGVAEVIEEISLGTVSKWLGYLKLQHTHLQNWASGETHKVELKSSTELIIICEVVDLVDEYNEHWLILYDESGVILIWNITEKPRELKPVNIGLCESIVVASPQGKVLIKKMDEYDATYMEVYKFENPEYVLTLQCKIKPSINSDDCYYLCMDNILIFYNSKDGGPNQQSRLLTTWDWHLGLELATVKLSNKDLLSKTKSQSGSVQFHKGVFPNALLVEGTQDSVQVNVFNLEAKRITHVVDIFDVSSSLKACSYKIISDYIYVWLRDECGGTVKLYSFTNNHIDLVFISGGDSMVDRGIPASLRSSVKTTATKIIFKSFQDSVSVIDVAADVGIKEYKCRVSRGCMVLGFIEPNLLFVGDECSLKVYNSFSNKELFSFDSLFGLIFVPHYPSKAIIIDDCHNKITILNF